MCSNTARCSNDDDDVRMPVKTLLKSSDAMRTSPLTTFNGVRPTSIAVNVVSLNATDIVSGGRSQKSSIARFQYSILTDANHHPSQLNVVDGVRWCATVVDHG